ncbi:hypothetical protein D9M69_679390 [compost metagenome]
MQPGEQEAEGAEQAQADQRIVGRPEPQTGAAGAEADEHQHAQHAQPVQGVGLGGLKGADRGPEKPRMGTEQAQQQGQGTAEAGHYGRPPGRRSGMPAEGFLHNAFHRLHRA